MVQGNGVEFMRKVGVVSGGIIGIVAVLGIIWGVAFAVAVRPAVEQIIADERAARASADSLLGERLADLSRDRVLILAVLESDPKDRVERLKSLREMWYRR